MPPPQSARPLHGPRGSESSSFTREGAPATVGSPGLACKEVRQHCLRRACTLPGETRHTGLKDALVCAGICVQVCVESTSRSPAVAWRKEKGKRRSRKCSGWSQKAPSLLSSLPSGLGAGSVLFPQASGHKDKSKVGQSQSRRGTADQSLGQRFNLHESPAHPGHVEQELCVSRFSNFPIQKLDFCKNLPLLKKPDGGQATHTRGPDFPAQHLPWFLLSLWGQMEGVHANRLFPPVRSWTSNNISQPLFSYLRDVDKNGYLTGLRRMEDNTHKNLPVGNQQRARSKCSTNIRPLICILLF